MSSEILPPRPRLPGQYGWLAQINWGHGMIGKASVVALGVLVVIGIAAARVPNEWAILLLVAAAIAVFLYFLHQILGFAERNPSLAATEGPTYVESQRINLAAKNLPIPPAAEIVADPQNPTLLAPTHSERGP